MLVHRLPYILYRDYPEFGYLTDNRNFGYDTASKSCLKVGELLLSKIGSIFYSQLSELPLDIVEIVNRLSRLFPDVQPSEIRKDAIEFYGDLHSKGFIYCGEDAADSSLTRSHYLSYNNTTASELLIAQNQADQSIYETTFGYAHRLTRVHIDISSRCNEKCIHCYIPIANKCSIMTAAMFELILNQCRELNVLNLTLSGGEPMINPSLKFFLLKCREYNFSVNLLSNLTLLSDDLLEVISDNPLICVQTSLYAMDADVHDKVTGIKGSYQKTISAIHCLHARNVPMQINCSIMKQNIRYYKDVLRFSESLNIEADADYSLFGCYDSSCSNLTCRLSTDEVEYIIKERLSDSLKNKNVGLKIENKDTAPSAPICPVCKHSLCISNNGNVYPCEGWQSLVLGNLEKCSLKEIWEDEPMTRQLRNLTIKDFPQCHGCADKKFCSTCLIMNANESEDGDYKDLNDFQCAVAKLKHRYYSCLLLQSMS